MPRTIEPALHTHGLDIMHVIKYIYTMHTVCIVYIYNILLLYSLNNCGEFIMNITYAFNVLGGKRLPQIIHVMCVCVCVCVLGSWSGRGRLSLSLPHWGRQNPLSTWARDVYQIWMPFWLNVEYMRSTWQDTVSNTQRHTQSHASHPFSSSSSFTSSWTPKFILWLRASIK